MRKFWLLSSLVGLAVTAPVAAWAVPIECATGQSCVEVGSDYFQTVTGTMFNGSPLFGNPFGPGTTDTIVQRTDDAKINAIQVNPLAGPNVFDSFTGLMITNLSLMNASTAAASTIFITLDLSNLANDKGTMWIYGTTAGGYFDSTLNVFFDICSGPGAAPGANGIGCASGTVTPGNVTLKQNGAPWSPTPPPGAILVFGTDIPPSEQAANDHAGFLQTFANGDPFNEVDFFGGFIGPNNPFSDSFYQAQTPNQFNRVTECDVQTCTNEDHFVVTAHVLPVPEPSTLPLFGVGLAALLTFRRRRKTA